VSNGWLRLVSVDPVSGIWERWTPRSLGPALTLDDEAAGCAGCACD